MVGIVNGKVLVTGHLGYVGTVLTPVLEQSGWQVTGADIDLYSACSVTALPNRPPCPIADFRDWPVEALGQFDAIVHLAGLSNDPLGSLDPGLTHAINHQAVVDLARRAREGGVRRFVVASSCSVYGGGGEQWLNETSATGPLTPYAQAKLDMEQSVRALCSPDFEVVIMRPGTVFGASPRLRFDLVTNNLIAWALSTGCIRLKSDGQAWRPLLHVRDLARAISGLLEAPSDQVSGQVFNIGFNTLNLRVIDLAERLAMAMPEARLQVEGMADSDQRSYRVDCSKLADLLDDWQPSAQPEDVVDELSELFAQRPLTPEQFEGPDLARVAHLRERMERGEIDRELRNVRP